MPQHLSVHPAQTVILWFFAIVVVCLVVHVAKDEWKQYKQFKRKY